MIQSYCITLDTTPKRSDRAKKLFNQLEFPINFYVAQKDPQGPRYGCWRSHLACWDDGISKGHKIIAVFEDDVNIPSRKELDYVFEESLKAFEEQNHIEFIALHGQVVPIEESKSKIKYGIPITVAAYVIHLDRFYSNRNRKKMEPTGNHIDYELFLNPKGSIHVKASVFEPFSKIMPGVDYGTTNDYGLFLNFIIRKLGYSFICKSLHLYMELMRKGPRNEFFRKNVLVRWNELYVKWLQPKS
jgi:hypothetical protein